MQGNTKVGITTTVPVEILYAANKIPLDINNIFITDENPSKYVDRAEKDGFPQNVCSWIKGLYGTILENNIKTVLAPVWGDCSNSFALNEILKDRGIEVIEFQYPYDRNKERLIESFRELYDCFSVSEDEVFKTHDELNKVRKGLKHLDDLTMEGMISSKDNHLFLVSGSDFEGNPDNFLKKINNKVSRKKRQSTGKRIALIGVPPIFTDLFENLVDLGFSVVYNEIPAEFSMIKSLNEDFYTKYINYSYPYGMTYRLETIKKEIKRRKVEAIIHYTQCFCYRQIEDILLRKYLDIPVLTLEGDRPTRLDPRTRMRLENFGELL